MPQQQIFISYAAEDAVAAERLINAVQGAGMAVTSDYRRAHRFLACFGESWNERELLLAIEHLQALPRAEVWLLPVKLAACELPQVTVGKSETLRDFPVIDVHRDALGRFARVLAALSVPPDTAHSANEATFKFGKFRTGDFTSRMGKGDTGSLNAEFGEATIDRKTEFIKGGDSDDE